MNSLSVFLFAIAGISLGVGAFYLMFSAAMSKEVRDYNAGKTPPPRVVHPEMEDVKEGDELMVVAFHQQSEDPLYKSLKERMDAGQIEDPWDEDDDEDDGGAAVPAVR